MQYLRIFDFRVYLQRYPKSYVQQIIDQSYAPDPIRRLPRPES